MTYYRLAWRNKETGEQGPGPVFTFFPRNYMLRLWDSQFPGDDHWVSVENGWPE